MPQFDQGYALVIGVGEYDSQKGFPSLPSTVRDAQEFSNVLLAQHLCAYPKNHVKLLIGEQATRTAIWGALQDLAARTDKTSTVVVYFSGHGGLGRSHTGELQAYLCPREADTRNLDGTAISRDQFSDLLQAIPAQKLLVILDSCYAAGAIQIKSGQAEPRAAWKAGVTQGEINRLAAGSGRAVLAASLNNEVAYSLEHLSLFTTHLIDGLQSYSVTRDDGLVRVLDLFNYITEATAQAFPSQTPILHAAHLDMNFPIALFRGGTKGAAGATPSARQREAADYGRAGYDTASKQPRAVDETTNVYTGGTNYKFTDNIFSGENVVIGTQNRNTYHNSYTAPAVHLTRTRDEAEQAGVLPQLQAVLDDLERELQKGPNASVDVVTQKLRQCQQAQVVYRAAVAELHGFEAALPQKLRMTLKTMI